jgi:AcrR family transcriptional regulator
MKNKQMQLKIINETKALIKKNGQVTIKDIAEACFINIASVNYYFGSKEELLTIVINQIIDELKLELSTIILRHKKQEDKEKILEEVITYTYNFALENTGILNYLFLTKDLQNTSSQLLINTFFSENEFTSMIFSQLSLSEKMDHQYAIYARYMILFSSFCMPLFISISQNEGIENNFAKQTFSDPVFRKYFIGELMNILNFKA